RNSSRESSTATPTRSSCCAMARRPLSWQSSSPPKSAPRQRLPKSLLRAPTPNQREPQSPSPLQAFPASLGPTPQFGTAISVGGSGDRRTSGVLISALPAQRELTRQRQKSQRR